MEHAKFVAGGKTGDLLHTLYAVKGICKKLDAKADLYITDNTAYGGDSFHFPIEKTYADLKDLILKQDYVNSFSILKDNLQTFVNLNNWRTSPKLFNTCWINILCEQYEIHKSKSSWIESDNDNRFTNKVVIHRSLSRFSNKFDWRSVVNNNDCVFVTSDKREYDYFPHKEKVELYEWSNFDDLARVIKSSKFFVGNMSTPLSLAHGLGVPRLAELYITDQVHYIGEADYFENYFYHSDTEPSRLYGIEKFIKL